MTVIINNQQTIINIFKKITGNKRGETIAETIIALVILTVGITLASGMMASSMRNMHSSKNRVIAVNIAREGIEAVRNIRDTNWLKFSGHRRDCWNHMPIAMGNGSTDADVCTKTTPNWIQPMATINDKDPTKFIFDTPPGGTAEAYVIYLDKYHRWRLENWEATTTAGNTFDNANIYLVDIDEYNDMDEFGDLNINEAKDIKHDEVNDRDMYNHKPVANITNNDALGFQELDEKVPSGPLYPIPTETSFKRIITIDYLDNDGTPLTSTGTLTNEHNRILVTSIVSWNQGKVRHNVQLKTHLTDYYGREKLEH
jgi:type II secretory pathway pseudopilin PulG